VTRRCAHVMCGVRFRPRRQSLVYDRRVRWQRFCGYRCARLAQHTPANRIVQTQDDQPRQIEARMAAAYAEIQAKRRAA
jgi:hypothetical protein